MRKTATILRYVLVVGTLLAGLVVSLQLSQQGFLLETPPSQASTVRSDSATQYDLEALNILSRVMMLLNESYVDPGRIEPNRMLVRSLDRVQNSVPEFVALFDRALDDSPRHVEVRVGAASEQFDLPELNSLWQMRAKMREIFHFVQSNTAGLDIDLREVEYAAINGMLSTLDPHSVLLSPKVYTEMQASNEGQFGGLGIVISIRSNQLTVISPIDDTPASRAGFRAGDKIVKINDESTVNMPLDEAVNRLRGAPGSEVTLEVMRTGWTEPHVFTLVREIISIESVTHHALSDGIGYVEIRSFQRNTHDDLMGALASLEEQMGRIRGLVLDLRNNPGGLLEQAWAVSNTFLSEGVIVTTVGAGDRIREERRATQTGTQPDYPIVILVNPGSASASEIVAGALKAHNRAVIVGDTTFGKGSVQVFNPFNDGSALKLTIAKYLTPGEISIQGTGIVPDIRTVPVSVLEDLIDLYPPEHVIRDSDLASSFQHQGERESERPAELVKFYFEQPEFDPEAIVDPNDFEADFEIDFARQVLIAAGTASERSLILARAADTIENIRNEQLAVVQERLRQRNIDWSGGSNVIQPVSVQVETQPASGRVQVGDTLSLTLRVQNDGSRPLHRVRAISHSDYGRFDDHEFVFGKLAPGESRSWTVRLDVPQEDRSRLDKVSFVVFADQIELDGSAETFVEVVERERPHWGFSYLLEEVDGNGDGLLQAGETVRFHMRAVNIGQGDAEESVLFLRNHSENAVFLNTGRETIDGLAVGESHLSSFEFELRSRPGSGIVTLEAAVYDTVFREYLSEKLEIPVYEESPRVESRVGLATAAAGPVEIRAGANEATPLIATLDAGGALPITAATAGWLRVQWEGGSGWVHEDAVEVGEAVARSPSPVNHVITYLPPVINLDAMERRTSESHIELRGRLSDDALVRDYYVFVESILNESRSETLKVNYEYVGAESATFSTRIPLRPGANQITVVARDNDRLSVTETLFVYRDE